MSTLSLRILLTFLLCTGGAATVSADEAPVQDPAVLSELEQSTFDPLFSALQQGDLPTIARYLEGDLYDQYRVLFEQNKEYGQYLRDYYADTVFVLQQVTTDGKQYTGTVTIYWPDGHSVDVALVVSPPDSQGHRVVDDPEG